MLNLAAMIFLNPNSWDSPNNIGDVSPYKGLPLYENNQIFFNDFEFFSFSKFMYLRIFPPTILEIERSLPALRVFAALSPVARLQIQRED